jgi:hypothetical protein
MHIVVLVLTVVFYGLEKPPVAGAFATPSLEECAAAGAAAQAQIPAHDQSVRDVEVNCLPVEQKDNT